jgi:hypothetical protein
MKQLFNCSCIKNVTLRIGSNHVIELEVTYLDDKENRWVYMKNISDIADKQYYKDKLANAYNTIKEALIGESRFVEIEL